MIIDACRPILFNEIGGVCTLPEKRKSQADRRDSRLMRSSDSTRVKRTLTALLLMFVLSLSAAFAEGEASAPAASEGSGSGTVQTGGEGGTASGGGQSPEVSDEQKQTADSPAVQTAPPESRIIKRGKYYYYKNPSGKLRTKAGFVTDLGNIYYVSKGGKIKPNKSIRVKKKYYRSNRQGMILTGIYKWKGKYNYSDASGRWKKSAGFVTWNGNTYYVRKGGAVVINDAFSVDNIPYDADASGCVTALMIPDGGGNPVIGVAKDQVGIKTGKKYWKWYFKTKFRDTDRTPWCGAFVAWCYNAAGQYEKVSVARSFGNLGYVPSYSRYANKYDKWVKKAEAQPGDIIIFGRNMHVGLVEGVYDNYIFTIEGNAGPTAAIGSKKPGAVVRNVYRINNKKIKGVIRP